MPSNTKTFLRQTTYAVSKHSSGSQETFSRHSLRHAVHMNLHMTAKKHLLLCSGLRLAFSNRPLESDEVLKVVTQKPSDPIYIPNQISPTTEAPVAPLMAQSLNALVQQR